MNEYKKVRLGDISTQLRGVSYKPADVLTEESDISSTLLRANNIFEDKTTNKNINSTEKFNNYYSIDNLIINKYFFIFYK